MKCLITKIESVFNIPDLSKINLNVKDYPNYFIKLSAICANHCDFNRAKSICKVALKLIQHGGVFCEGDLAAVYNVLGNVHHSMGEFQESKEYHERAVTVRIKKLGSQHIDVAQSYNNMARVLFGQGDLEQAMEYHSKSAIMILHCLFQVTLVMEYLRYVAVTGCHIDMLRSQLFYPYNKSAIMILLCLFQVTLVMEYSGYVVVTGCHIDMLRSQLFYPYSKSAIMILLCLFQVTLGTEYSGYVVVTGCDIDMLRSQLFYPYIALLLYG